MNLRVLKRWIPFATIIIIATISFGYMVFYGKEDPYLPSSDRPEKIYVEACQHCHGDTGQGTGLLYPGFDFDELDKSKVEEKITSGDWLMPAFKYIRGDTLSILAEYVLELKSGK